MCGINILTGVDNVHGTHRTTGIVEYPFLVMVDIALDAGLVTKLMYNVVDDGPGVVPVDLNSLFGELVKLLRVEYVKGLQVLFQQIDYRGQNANQNGKELEKAADAALR